MQKPILSLTAYKCRICEKRKNEDLLTMEEEIEAKVDIENVLREYIEHIENPKIGKNSNRTIGLSREIKINEIGDWKKYSIYTQAGKLGEDFDVYNHSTQKSMSFSGEDNSAMYFQRTYCFINKKTKENIFVFFRYGLGGCKTAFQETLNQMLAGENQIAHFDVQLSQAMFDDDNNGTPEKLTLVTRYEITSSDSAENIKKTKRKKMMETIIYLDAPNAFNITNYLARPFDKKPTLDELKTITIQDNLGGNFDEAYVTLKFGRASRKIKFEDFTGSIAEYDITNKVEYFADGKRFKEGSLDAVVDDFAFSFFC